MGLCVIQTSPFRSCSFTPHPPPQNTLFNLFNTFTYKVERQYPLMCLLWLCRPMPMAPTWHHPGGQRGHRSARPHATQRAPHTSTSRAHVHTTTRSTYRQSPSPAISFPGMRQSPSTSISMVPSLALAPADLGPHRGDVVMRTTNMLTRTVRPRRLPPQVPCTLYACKLCYMVAPWVLALLVCIMHAVELIFTHSFEQTRPDRRSLSGGRRPLQPLPYANGAFPPRSTWWFENTKRVRRPGVGGGLGEGGRRRRVRHGRGAWRCAPAHEHLPLARLTRHSRPIL
jgi:hypothetical protein